jgi:putative ABC transport system permease protein
MILWLKEIVLVPIIYILLLGIGVLILLIASINFINLSIGRSFTRSHEIGLRKTLGALKSHVVLQLWVEALLLCFIALAMSAVLTYVLLPHYTQLFQMSVAREILYSPSVWIFVLIGFLLISIIAGGYPAWMVARVNIISIFRGKFSIKTSSGIRNGLIVVQFAIAVLLMICTFVTWQQVNYLRSRPIGFNRNQVISVPIEGKENPNIVLERLRQKLSSSPQVVSVSGIYNNLGRGLDGSTRSSVVSFDYKNRNLRSKWLGVSYDFIKTLDLELVEGRDFSRQFPTDSTAMVINESMAKLIGEKNVIGVQLPVHDSATPMTVIGVVKDFNYESLHNKIGPVSFVIEEPFGVHYALIKVAPANLPQSMDLIAGVWKEILPNAEFKGSFVDENIERQYRREAKMGQIFISGAIIAIVLSCMGLLAMVILIVTQRVKEIGIRKVLGASVSNIVMLISKDFLWLVIIAFVIAAPFAWWGMQKWLDNFAYRISIEWWVFAIVAVLAVMIAFLTISIQAVKAAMANPVDNLRTE